MPAEQEDTQPPQCSAYDAKTSGRLRVDDLATHVAAGRYFGSGTNHRPESRDDN